MELVYGVSHVDSVYFKTWVAIDFSTGCDSSDHSCYIICEEKEERNGYYFLLDLTYIFSGML